MRHIMAALFALVLAAGGCSDGGSSAGDTLGPAHDGGTDQLASGDSTTTGPGTSCKPQQTVVVYEDTGGHAGWQPQIAWSGTGGQYGITWAQEIVESSTVKYQPYFARVGADGTAKGQPKSLTQGATMSALGPSAISAINVGFAVAWSDTRNGDPQIYMLRMNDSGEPMQGPTPCTTPGCGEIQVTAAPAEATMPYMARRAYVDIEGPTVTSDLALVWRDARKHTDPPYPGGPEGGQYDVYFKVINPGDGADKLGEKRITTDTTKVNEREPGWPRIAYNDNKYTVVWRNLTYGADELYYNAVNPDGTTVGPAQSLATLKGLLASTPDLVWADGEFGIGYSEAPSPDVGIVRFARITKDGNVMAIQQVSDAGKPCTPAVAYNGKHYAMIWQDNCGQAPSQLQFALIAADGTPLKPDGSSCAGSSDPACGLVKISPDTDAAESVHAFPEMISVGGRFAVTWMNAPKDRVYFSHVVCE